MTENLFRVSNSKVKMWRKCRQAYHFRYVERLRRKRVARPLMFGRLVHDMIEAYANADEPFNVLDAAVKEQGPMFKAEREEYGDLANDVRIIMTEYFDHDWKKNEQLTYARMNKKGAEHTFEVEIADGLVCEGKIDAIAKTPNRLRWLVEHKSFGRLPSDDHRWRDMQSNLYVRIIEMLGLDPVDGVCWDYISSKPPGTPQLLKDGTLSKKMMITLPTKIRQVLKEHKLKEKDYPRLLQMAAQNTSQYFVRIFAPTKKKVVDYLYEGFVKTALEIRDFHGKRQDMVIDRHCDWCDFEPICRARLTGGDVDFLKKKEYTVSEKFTREDPDFEA